MPTEDLVSTRSSATPTEAIEVTVVLPCLNEAETLAVCVRKALGSLRELGVRGEVLVSDNGSTDGSQRIAEENGARVVHAPIRGYGGALMAGIEAARGKYVIMADADVSYDLSRLGPFIARLREGHDLVMGNRFKGGIARGAMPFLHRYLGNPVLSWLGRRLFRLPNVGDFHCGIRGFNRERILALGLCMPGMEFASELVVRSSLAGYSIVEVPTTLHKDGRSRPPHLRTWRDGWRHLRFLLVLSPRHTLVRAGLTLAFVSGIATLALAAGPVSVGGWVTFDVNALAFTCMGLLVGVQMFLFGGFAEVYGRAEGIVREEHFDRWQKWLTLENCAAIGLVLIVIGLGGSALAVGAWGSVGFGEQDARAALRVVLPSATAVGTGILVIFSGLLASLLTLRSASPGAQFANANGSVNGGANGHALTGALTREPSQPEVPLR